MLVAIVPSVTQWRWDVICRENNLIDEDTAERVWLVFRDSLSLVMVMRRVSTKVRVGRLGHVLYTNISADGLPRALRIDVCFWSF